ncbi:hypothetical protein PSHT_00078 [Puccinia striiformis]|uniref:Uncharacterized protein n=1 Tax=Puccinia striiformis TaxID=27350 RepID=A0A2S4WP94_9BASI|nr:hypothetical protein PSHT_00078 [Puccinia striiformis]
MGDGEGGCLCTINPRVNQHTYTRFSSTMGLDPTQEFVRYVLTLPPSVNPYLAVLEKMTELTKVHGPPLWARILRRIITFQFCILIGQCLTVLHMRKKANQLKFFRLNKLGLIRIEVLNEIVLFMLMFSLLCALDLATEELMELGLMPFSYKMVLRLWKFMLTANVFCDPFIVTKFSITRIEVFLWISGIEVAMAFTSLRARSRAGSSIRLPPWVRYAANGSFLAVLTIPTIFVFWYCIRTTLQMKAIEVAIDKIMNGLFQAAPNWRPENYHVMDLFQIFKPAEVFATEMEHLITDVRVIIFTYLLLHLTATTLKPELLQASHSNFSDGFAWAQQSNCSRHRSKEISCRRPMAQYQTPAMMKLLNEGPAQERAALEEVRKRLLKYACLLYVDTMLLSTPDLHVNLQRTKFLHSSTWMVVEQVGTHVHTATLGNIILALLVQNTLYTTSNSSGPGVVVEKKPAYVTFASVSTSKDSKDDSVLRSLA